MGLCAKLQCLYIFSASASSGGSVGGIVGGCGSDDGCVGFHGFGEDDGGDGDVGDDSCGCGGNSGGQKEKRQNGRFGVWTMCAACGPVDNGAVISRI